MSSPSASVPARTAASKGDLVLTFDAIQSLMESYESCTALTPAELASGIGTPSSVLGLLQTQKERSGYELGLRRGAISVMQSPILENLTSELSLLRKLVSAMTEAAIRQDRMIATLNRIKNEALSRVIYLARELDKRAPGWDK